MRLENGGVSESGDLATEPSRDLPLLVVLQFQKEKLKTMTAWAEISIVKFLGLTTRGAPRFLFPRKPE
jgi:hypothetical protein